MNHHVPGDLVSSVMPFRPRDMLDLRTCKIKSMQDEHIMSDVPCIVVSVVDLRSTSGLAEFVYFVSPTTLGWIDSWCFSGNAVIINESR